MKRMLWTLHALCVALLACFAVFTVACAWRETPRPVPVPGATCEQGCEHVYVTLDCGGHPIDVFACTTQCQDGLADPECLAGADSCSAARLCQ